MNLPTVNSQEFLNAFHKGDYPTLVTIADSFAVQLALDAVHDLTLQHKLISNGANFLTQQQEENERNNPDTNYA